MGRVERSGMSCRAVAALRLLVVAAAVSSLLQGCIVAQGQGGGGALTRGSFPEGFVFGTASSAYQVCCAVAAWKRSIFLLLLKLADVRTD
jgi:hypothetical protein